jgi:hypothetical protein
VGNDIGGIECRIIDKKLFNIILLHLHKQEPTVNRMRPVLSNPVIVEGVVAPLVALEVLNDELLDSAATGLVGEDDDLVGDYEYVLELLALGAGELLDEVADEVARLAALQLGFGVDLHNVEKGLIERCLTEVD